MPCKMKSIVILLIFTGCLGVNGFYYKHELEESFDENDELLGVVSARNNDLLQPTDTRYQKGINRSS